MTFNYYFHFDNCINRRVHAKHGESLENPTYPLHESDTAIPIYLNTVNGQYVQPRQLATEGGQVEILNVKLWKQKVGEDTDLSLLPLSQSESDKYVKWKWTTDTQNQTVFSMDKYFMCWLRFTHLGDPNVHLETKVTVGLICMEQIDGPCSKLMNKTSFMVRTMPHSFEGINNSIEDLMPVARTPKRGFLCSSQYYDMRKSLEAAAESGDMTYFYSVSQSCQEYFNKLFMQQGDRVHSVHFPEVKLVTLIEKCGAHYYQNNIDKAEESVAEAKGLLSCIKYNQSYYTARCCYYDAAINRKRKKIGSAEKAVKQGHQEMQYMFPGEDTAEVIYNEARVTMQFITTSYTCSMDKMKPIVKLFDESIRHYNQDPYGNGNNKICRCHLNVAQLYLDCPSHTTNWFTRTLPDLEQQPRLKKAKYRLSTIREKYWESLTKRNYCRFLYTMAGYKFRKSDLKRCAEKLTECLRIATVCNFDFELKLCNEFQKCLDQMLTSGSKSATVISVKEIRGQGTSEEFGDDDTSDEPSTMSINSKKQARRKPGHVHEDIKPVLQNQLINSAVDRQIVRKDDDDDDQQHCQEQHTVADIKSLHDFAHLYESPSD